jgi:ATP adenylyltransferase
MIGGGAAARAWPRGRGGRRAKGAGTHLTAIIETAETFLKTAQQLPWPRTFALEPKVGAHRLRGRSAGVHFSGTAFPSFARPMRCASWRDPAPRRTLPPPPSGTGFDPSPTSSAESSSAKGSSHGVQGLIIVVEDRLGAWGDVEVVPLGQKGAGVRANRLNSPYENDVAPRRIEYVLGEKEKGCVFCKALSNSDELTLFKGAETLVVMNKYPYNNGHLLVAPVRHIAALDELSLQEMGVLLATIEQSVAALKKAMRPEGFNVGLNLGKIAGAREEHLHFHIVPRWSGDTNAPGVFADVR